MKYLKSVFLVLPFFFCIICYCQKKESYTTYSISPNIIRLGDLAFLKVSIVKCQKDEYLMQLHYENKGNVKVIVPVCEDPERPIIYRHMSENDFINRIMELIWKGNVLEKDAKTQIEKFKEDYVFKVDVNLIYRAVESFINNDVEEVLKNNKNVELDEDSLNLANHIQFFNAANFDFSGTDLKTKYLAALNLFCPSAISNRWGFYAGMEKINYSSYNDSNNVQFIYQNILSNPLDFNFTDNTVANGTSFNFQFNKYTANQTNSALSFFIQPTYRILDLDSGFDSKICGIYAHAHFELLINRWTATVSLQNIKSIDTNYAVTPSSYYFQKRDKYYDSKSFLSGYFGLGVTFFLRPFGKKNNHSFFLCQVTVGATDNTVNVASQDLSQNKLDAILQPDFVANGTRKGESSKIITTSNSHGFYLVKASLLHKLTSQSQLVIGTQIRGILPNHKPLYAAYLGLNLDLSALIGQ